MKFHISAERIPQAARSEINEKILFLIEADTCEENNITAQDIFSSFTGKGNLHNLDFNDFENRYEYTEAKKLSEVGQFFTPAHICKFMVDCIKPNETETIADLTFGMGNFFNFCPNEYNCHGTELDPAAFKVAKFLYPNANLQNEDIRLYAPKSKFDIVFGNPPFNLWWKTGGEEYLSQLFYFIKAAQILKPAGILSVIVPASFLADDFMDKKKIELVNQDFNFIAQFSLPKNAFKDFGVSSFATKIMFFQRKSDSLPEVPYSAKTEDLTLVDAFAKHIHETHIKPILETKKKLHAKLLLEMLSKASKQEEFHYQVKKLLWDIRNSKHTKAKYTKAADYVSEFYAQEKPKEMDSEEWEKVRITENKVLSYLKKILKNQHLVERDEIRIVKNNYGLSLKAYSRKSKIQLNKNGGSNYCTFTDMTLQGTYPFAFNQYRKLVNRKSAQYVRNNVAFENLKPAQTKSIEKWIIENPIFDYSASTELILTDTQRKDTAAMIYKGYGILDWEQGSGKSLAAIHWFRYYLPKVRNVFLLGPAIAVRLTWDKILTDYRENYIMIDSMKKIEQIKPGQVVLISYDMLCKYERQIKRFVKVNNQKFALVVDESDEMTNYTSKRTKVARNCFRKLPYKLLTTGTTTRNNINELYPQLELIYNNSIGMLSKSETIYNWNSKDSCMDEKTNGYYMKPFPARYGNGLFKSSFSPYKQTVFGIKKHNQDVYNSEHLIEIIAKTIITRTFFEITGKKPEFETVRVKQNPAEEYVYDIVINEFYKVAKYFRNTGNARKERMLQIIRQIQLLIKATSIPHKLAEYNSKENPAKQNKILEMVKRFKSEKVAIGTVFIDAAEDYFDKLQIMFPDRPIFLIKGEVNFKQRKNIIAEFEATTNGIIVSTQQSLKSSVNIPSCDKVIIESLMWNLPKISQYYMRFVRYNSVIENKKIFFVVYENSIEMNLLALLMDKQRLNEFIKNREFQERENIFEEYNIDFDLIDMILEKVEYKEGKQSKIKIGWGQQKVG